MQKQQGISSFSEPVRQGVPTLSGMYLSQVIGVVPAEHAVNVMLPALTTLEHSADRGGLKVSVLSRRAGNFVGEVDLPRVGDWGVVCFLQGSHQFPVWLGSLYQTYAGLQTAKAGERIAHHDSGVYSRMDPDGNVEWSHPSGTYIRIGSGTTLTARTRKQRKAQSAESETIAYAIPSKPTPTVHVSHASGTTITIAPNGKVTVHSADEAVVYGDSQTHLGEDGAQDFVALKAAVEKIQQAYDVHQHDSSAPPSPQVGTLIAGTDYTTNVKAS